MEYDTWINILCTAYKSHAGPNFRVFNILIKPNFKLEFRCTQTGYLFQNQNNFLEKSGKFSSFLKKGQGRPLLTPHTCCASDIKYSMHICLPNRECLEKYYTQQI